MDRLRQLLGPFKQPAAPSAPPSPPVRVVFPAGTRFPIDQINFDDLVGRAPVTTVIVPPQAPDFKGVYGRTLEELEREWLEQLATAH